MSHDEELNFTPAQMRRLDAARKLVSAGDFHLSYGSFIVTATMHEVDSVLGANEAVRAQYPSINVPALIECARGLIASFDPYLSCWERTYPTVDAEEQYKALATALGLTMAETREMRAAQ